MATFFVVAKLSTHSKSTWLSRCAISNSKIESRKKVPILGDIPILGAPFNSFNNQKNRVEIVILLTPHVVYGDTLVTGEGKAADRPFMSYADYGAAKPGALRS